MTGAEFKAALRGAGYSQQDFAGVMGVHRDTIAKRCHSEAEVEPYWTYALAGIMAAGAVNQIRAVIELAPINL